MFLTGMMALGRLRQDCCVFKVSLSESDTLSLRTLREQQQDLGSSFTTAMRKVINTLTNMNSKGRKNGRGTSYMHGGDRAKDTAVSDW